MTVITVVGLGEAGRLYASGLAEAGATVRGYDPFLQIEHSDFEQFESLRTALTGCDVVLSLVGGRFAETVARQVAESASSELVLADLNTASPEAKVAVGEVAIIHQVVPCDAAVMAPVPRAGHRTPLIVSGPGSMRFAKLLAPLGVPIEAIEGNMGDAAQVKLLRSVFMKGLATVIVETLEAAEILGQRDRLAGQIALELGPDGAALVERLVTGTFDHAERRTHEMQDALAELERLGAPHVMTSATIASLQRILLAQGGAMGEPA